MPTSIGSQRRQGNSRKASTSASLTKAFDCVDHNKLWKILTEMRVPDHFTSPLRNLYAGQAHQLEPDMKQLIGSKLGKKYDKTVCCHPAHLTYMQSTSCEMSGWMNLKLESRLQTTLDMQMISL